MPVLIDLLLQLIADLLIEKLICTPGTLILRLFRRHISVEPDGFLAFVVGLLFWCLVIAVCFRVF